MFVPSLSWYNNRFYITMAHLIKGVLRTDREVGTVPIGKARGAVRSCGQKRVSFFERFLSVCPEPVLVNVWF